MGFTQIIEFETDDIDAFNEEVDRWFQESADFRTATRVMLCEDRDKPGTYVHIVEFPSYEAAMKNSNDPRTQEFGERLTKLTSGNRRFRNLDVVRTETL